MLRVVINKAPITAKSVKTGKDYKYQTALVYFHDREGNAEEFPRPVRMFVMTDQPGYAPGEYVIDPDRSFRSAPNDNIEVRLVLTPAVGVAVGGARARAA